MGFGLAVAVLLDATIIRGVLLPATMKILGRANWYAAARPSPAAAVEPRGPAAAHGGRVMTALLAPLREAATYRSLLFLASAIPLGTLAFTVLVVGWTLTAVLLITPAVVAALIGFRAVVVGRCAAGGAARPRAPRRERRRFASRALRRPRILGPHEGRRSPTVRSGASRRTSRLRAAVGLPAGIVALALPAASLYVVSLPVYLPVERTPSPGGSTRCRKRCSYCRSGSPGSCSRRTSFARSPARGVRSRSGSSRAPTT